ncbi:DUF3237 domain-containing protein [Pseudofrankia inefficax]|uniref:UPF0311 protein FraEuI1c_4557 n=1 Tax=Pseudofrankia inefficax (strain DSM 45817 / CECT 9037 / DDB 130130 / EuI1c) TaxID=298654 RepID=E3IVP4_PSEI1|nr:DUF3237 domain-containing protein [Pseudofrankia inefficax]ADP82550.1 hypothetical protein FraEuI1c_4557 [Pseudofrankia inefficax]
MSSTPEPAAPAELPPPPPLLPMAQVRCDVGAVVSLGQAAYGERRFVPLAGGTVRGPELNGTLVEGGVDWQVARADGVLDIAAHYVIRADDGALIEVRSDGLRHGPPEVMARLARGEPIEPDAYVFRTIVRFTTGAPAWLHLNRTVAIGVGRREPRRVVLSLYRVT